MTRAPFLLIALAAAAPATAQDRFGRPFDPGERERARVESIRQTHVENQRLSDDVAAAARARIDALRAPYALPQDRQTGTARGVLEGSTPSVGVPVSPPPRPRDPPPDRAEQD